MPIGRPTAQTNSTIQYNTIYAYNTTNRYSNFQGKIGKRTEFILFFFTVQIICFILIVKCKTI